MIYPMQPFRRSKFISLLIACALLCTTTLAQTPSQQTRPRRAQDTAAPTPSPPSAPAPSQISVTRLSAEPLMRIGLATDQRSVNISTSGRLVSVTDESATVSTPLTVSRVRLEPRLLAPPPQPSAGTIFRVEIKGAATRVDAERAAREIQSATGEASEIAFDVATNTWRIRVGKQGSRAEMEELQARIEEAGFANASIVDASSANPSSASTTSTGRASTNTPQSPSSGGGTVRPVSRASIPTREIAAYAAPGRALILSSRAPLTFASEDERNAPVRFNEKPYRGRLEVFTAPSGTLTVVNVIGLEDYVRGVVPNELSPGGYGLLEALKAQAVAARTYAVKNRNQFASDGFDLLPTTRSQVYGGLSTEHSLSTRAVEETRGMIATYKGEPINALYTSTCGGRTENVENIFNTPTPYLRGRECSIEGHAHFAPFTVKSSRELADIREEQNSALARDVAVLSVNDFPLASAGRLNDAWLSSAVTQAEVRNWLMVAARLSRQSAPTVASDDATKPPGFSTALMSAVYGPAYADTLLDDADVEYLLPARELGDIPARNRADVAMLLRDGHLALYADASLHVREAMTRARALHTIARLLEARGILQLQKGTTKPTIGDALVLRSVTKGRDQPVSVSDDAYLFRAYGEGVYQMRQVALVGGEPVTFHLNKSGQVDYLEVRPAPNGAAADRFSPFTNWTVALSTGEAQSRLARWSRGIGTLTDLRIAARGWSRRVTDLEIVGTNGTNHLRGGRIRSALGLREQLFVIERRYDETGRVVGFNMRGRGWGHGVGMCQVGAYGLARAGLPFDKILKAYYTGIEVTRLY
ncbi:MAG TPA: SpoIID/LytB domain-containing protein [Pyrinomonadaceae bacterium]|nr:SpoIID/LytB domain-containing protein [Pyrinomonadaceae bacterium]